MLKLALKQQRELRLAVTIDVSIPLFIHILCGGYRAGSWSLGAQSSAFGAELAALVRAIEICALDACGGRDFRIFTGSQAAMRRLQSDQPGPGQSMARRGIQIARQGIYGRGAKVRVMWVPGHRGVPGNELADCCAGEEAERAEALRRAMENMADEIRLRQGAISISFIKSQARKRANEK